MESFHQVRHFLFSFFLSRCSNRLDKKSFLMKIRRPCLGRTFSWMELYFYPICHKLGPMPTGRLMDRVLCFVPALLSFRPLFLESLFSFFFYRSRVVCWVFYCASKGRRLSGKVRDGPLITAVRSLRFQLLRLLSPAASRLFPYIVDLYLLGGPESRLNV